MSNNIDALLKRGKGKLTGDEAGRLMIADLVALYKNALEGKDASTGIFSDKEKSAIANAVEGRDEIHRYNQYRYLNDFLTRFPALTALQEQRFENYYFRLCAILRETQNAESEYFHDSCRPLVVTEDEYRELAARELEEKKRRTYTPEELFFDRLAAILYDYRQGKRTGINRAIDATKKQPIKRERIRAGYWESGEHGHYETKDGKTADQVDPIIWDNLLSSDELVFIDEREAPAAATAYDALESALEFYSSGEVGEGGLDEFKEDYPAIWDFVWKKLTACKALSFIGDLCYAEYFKECITLEELAAANAFDYRHELTTFEGINTSAPFGGIAVIKVHGGTTPHVNELGYRIPHYRALAERLLQDDISEIITDYIEQLKDSLIELHCYNSYLILIRDKLKIDGLEIFVCNTARLEGLLTHLNDMFGRFYHLTRYGIVPDEMPADELNAALKKLLQPIKIMALRPPEETVARYRADLTLEALEGKGFAIFDNMLQDVKDAIEGVYDA